MRTARTELNLTELVVLAVICEGPTHGWRIVRALRARGELGEVWSSSGPLIYRAIARLQDSGHVAAHHAPGEHGPDRMMLEATPSGTEQIGEWLIRPVDHIRDLRTELLLKLLLLKRRGLDQDVLVRRQLERLRPIADALTARIEELDGRATVVDRWRASNAEAAMAFLESMLADGAGEAGAAFRDAGAT